MKTTAIRYLTIKTFLPGNHQHKTRTLKCKPGTCLTEQGLTGYLNMHAQKIERLFPNDEYSLKQIGRNQFNFVWIGKKPDALAV